MKIQLNLIYLIHTMQVQCQSKQMRTNLFKIESDDTKQTRKDIVGQTPGAGSINDI